MIKQPIYGLPLFPMHLLEQLRGAGFSVSFATRHWLGKQLDQAINLVGAQRILLVDNGAYSYFKKGRSSMDGSYLDEFEEWARDILDRCPQAIAVIPDVIEGTVEQNIELLHMCQLDPERCMAIWHLNEPLSHLLYLCESYNYVGFGSAGEYWEVGTTAWHARIREAFAAIDKWETESNGAYIRPRLHMMRAQCLAHLYPFDSSDSTNVARNHHRYRNQNQGHVARFATRTSAKIRAASGAESEHQLKRPLLDHEEHNAWYQRLLLDQLLEHAGYRVTSLDRHKSSGVIASVDGDQAA